LKYLHDHDIRLVYLERKLRLLKMIQSMVILFMGGHQLARCRS